MSGEDIATVLEAADTFQAFVLLALFGVFLIVWKYGRELLALVRETREHATQISSDIVTNHGSANLGNAVDRLYECLVDLQTTRELDAQKADQRQASVEKQLGEVHGAFLEYVSTMRPLVEFGRERMAVVLGEQVEGGEGNVSG